MAKAIMLTGRPGVGKTTLVRRVIEELDRPAGGFYTRELREGGRRAGFEIVTLGGETATLSHVDIDSEQRVSKYGVDVEALDQVGVPAIREAVDEGALVVIDEIGKMELYSDAFKTAVADALDSASPVLGTIMRGSRPWADRIKRRDNVEVIEVTVENRDRLVDELTERLREA